MTEHPLSAELTETSLTRTPLTDAEQQQVTDLMAQIDINDPLMAIAYGANTMNSISRFSEMLMSEVRAKDAGEIGQQITDLLMKVKGIDPGVLGQKKSWLASIPVVGKLFNRLERTLLEYQTLTQQVDTLTEKLQQAQVGLLRNIATLEQLFQRNREFFQQISLHIIAGKQKLQQIEGGMLAEAQNTAQNSGDAMDAQRVRDLLEAVQRFERRLHDLLLSRTIAIQTAPQVRLMQSNSQSLAEKIQSSILSTIPIWKSQMVLAISLHSQRQAAALQKEVADTTNQMLKRNAELLQSGSVETATQVERSVVDIETLRDVQSRLLTTLEDTLTIASDARSRRLDVEQELVGMEQEMKQRLAAINSGKSPKMKVV
ncbi:toxic anion resistance protein [Erwinia sp. AnSW2-5]|uniref:toxic anion resistance protein n=1 Tax=Erwinia sp. AnSW2-5 TaxID=3367692 RepID=UPI003858A244